MGPPPRQRPRSSHPHPSGFQPSSSGGRDMRFCIALLLATTARAQLTTTHIGTARLSDGSVRRVSGVAGSVVSSQPVMHGVLRFAASDRFSVAKLEESVQVFDAN